MLRRYNPLEATTGSHPTLGDQFAESGVVFRRQDVGLFFTLPSRFKPLGLKNFLPYCYRSLVFRLEFPQLNFVFPPAAERDVPSLRVVLCLAENQVAMESAQSSGLTQLNGFIGAFHVNMSGVDLNR